MPRLTSVSFVVVITIVLLSSVIADKIDDDYAKYQKKQGKKYATDEERTYRGNIYRRTAERVNKHNSDPSRTYDEGINQFADTTNEEFSQGMLMKASALAPDVAAASTAGNTTTSTDTKTTATADGDVKVSATPKDWSSNMTPIKNQYWCGSCWAFTAIGLVEGGIKIKYGATYNFAEQELVDCCSKYITSICSVGSGCNGGNSEQALNFMNVYGITQTASYPYTSSQGSCKYNSMSHYKVLNSAAPVTYVTKGSAYALQTSIFLRPTGVYLDANSWQYYSSGIFNGCTYTSLNHAVIAVGYDSAVSYWKIRNSWGTGWGELGHIRIANVGNPCGVFNYPFYTTVV